MADIPSTNNSLTQFLAQLLRIQKNSMEIVGKLTQVTASSSPSVKLQLENEDGTTQTYEVPGIGYIQNEIGRIDKNFNSLTGQDGQDVTVRMPDGSFKKIIQSTLFKEPAKIGNLLVPSTFNRKNNWFFESFLNPLLYVSFDITNYVQYDTQQVAYKRVILNTDTDVKKQYFDGSLKGRNDVDYDRLIRDLASQNISYFVDEDLSTLPISIARYSGSFDVISFQDETVPILQPNGTTIQTKVRKYRVNTLNYTDNLQNFKNTMTLKPGDKLDVGTASQYEVTGVESSTNIITVKITSGTESIQIGTGVIRISVDAFSLKEVQLNVGFDERQVIFIKAIDKTTNLTTRDYSPGVAFYTNELIISVNGTTYTLENYYKQEVLDFGSSLLANSKEATIPSVYGEIPDPPRLTSSDFTVSLVNSQKFDTETITNLKNKIAQKTTVSTEITQLDTAIEKKKLELNTAKFNTDTERRAVQNQLDDLIGQKTAKSNLYASIIKDLSTTAKNLPPELSSPKYRARGFFPIPTAKPSTKTTDQNVISFRVSYRYLRKDGTAPGTEQIDFTDNNGETVRGYYSNWEEYDTKIRQKVYDSETGLYVWADESVQNADEVNINQIDIPISKGEQVELRIKSISEAGWPINPMMSDWSSSIIIPFPDSFSNDEEVLASLSSSLSEETRVDFNQDLAARGLDTHLATSSVQRDKYIAHTAEVISSGFFTAEGIVIDLYQKLKEMDSKITELKAIIEKVKGKLQVSIIDPSGNKSILTNNTVSSLFAGYYLNQVNALPAPQQKGAIITSIFKLVIENSAVTPLQLASSFPGGLDVNLPISATSTNQDYANSRRYDIVPISLQSVQSTANDKPYQKSPFQSAQRLSQYLYVRHTDIGLLNPLYGSIIGPSGPIENNTFYPSLAGPSTTFIWNYTYTGTAPNGGGPLGDFSVHILHPAINDGVSTPSLSQLNEPVGASSNPPAVYPQFVHSSFFNLEDSTPNGKLQTQYFPTDLSIVKESYPIKLGFSNNDRYLVGPNTCGCYLFLAPPSYSDLLVDGTDYRSVREVEFGEENQITIPVIFQYRMTDFFGAGSAGTGRVGGSAANLKNLSYTKTIGIDINVKDETVFSFDLQINAKYQPDTPNQTSTSPVNNIKLVPKQTNLVAKIF